MRRVLLGLAVGGASTVVPVFLALVVAFVLSMQTFLNVAVWVWLAKIFPLHMRGLEEDVSTGAILTHPR